MSQPSCRDVDQICWLFLALCFAFPTCSRSRGRPSFLCCAARQSQASGAQRQHGLQLGLHSVGAQHARGRLQQRPGRWAPPVRTGQPAATAGCWYKASSAGGLTCWLRNVTDTESVSVGCLVFLCFSSACKSSSAPIASKFYSATYSCHYSCLLTLHNLP